MHPAVGYVEVVPRTIDDCAMNCTGRSRDCDKCDGDYTFTPQHLHESYW